MEPPKKKRKPYRTIKSDCPAKMSIRTIKVGNISYEKFKLKV